METPSLSAETPVGIKGTGNFKRSPAASQLAEVSGFQYTCVACPYLKIAERLGFEMSLSAEDCIKVKVLAASDGNKVPCGIAVAAIGFAGREGLL